MGDSPDVDQRKYYIGVAEESCALGSIDFQVEADTTVAYAKRFAIKAPAIFALCLRSPRQSAEGFVLSRWLATKPAVLILDEPTQGVDVGAKAEIHALMGDLAAEGMAILMISSELPELLGMCDRIAVMRAGAIAGFLDRRQATQQRYSRACVGPSA